MNLNKQKRAQFYKLQKEATAWLTETFDRYVCNWQDFAARHQFEQFTCVKGETIALVLIVYRLDEPAEFWTYTHCLNFPDRAHFNSPTGQGQNSLFVATNNDLHENERKS